MPNVADYKYLDLLADVKTLGVDRADRTGVGTRALWARQMRFDLSLGFPLLTSKKVHFHSVAVELLWFLKGETNVEYLLENGVTIWDEWADPNGDLGRVYGAQWRRWQGVVHDTSREGYEHDRVVLVDQIAAVTESLKTNPYSRRHVVSAWNPAELGEMALPPCHVMFQFFVANGRLSLAVTQRSADVFLGVPFNIASYALLLHLMAVTTGYQVGELVWTGNDVHLYHNHFEQAHEQLYRAPVPDSPRLVVKNRRANLWEYELEDFELVGYDPLPAIKADVAV